MMVAPLGRVEEFDECCKKVNWWLKKRFGDDAGSFAVSHCLNWPSKTLMRGKCCVWAPSEELSYPESMELLEALKCLWR